MYKETTGYETSPPRIGCFIFPPVSRGHDLVLFLMRRLTRCPRISRGVFRINTRRIIGGVPRRRSREKLPQFGQRPCFLFFVSLLRAVPIDFLRAPISALLSGTS